ncbi:flavodoxin domain-containing protein [Dehalogenimonas sp. THU2]|uniref:flavodoxin domain-containing protein n=1 Tax=Dehalogenimonas sp. THU2 TaxID=3151121 RepID=UPI003218953E
MGKIVIGYQSFTGSCKALAQAAAEGVAQAGGKAEVKNITETSASDLANADAFILVTTQPFQSLAGDTKKFFETLWPAREQVRKGLSFAAIICHANEAVDSAAALDKFATYLGWKKFGDWVLAAPAELEVGKISARQLGIAVAQGG